MKVYSFIDFSLLNPHRASAPYANDMSVQRALCVLLLIFYYADAEDNKEELVESESKDGKLEIVKQIKKINEDGTYTIGYEADDGSFKIESRDVLGNIKGTYGYVDDDGEIKRVSYSTANTSEVVTKTESTPSVVQRIPRINRTQTTTTRRFSSVYPTTSTRTTPVSTTTVIQTIPRRRTSQTITTSTTSSTTEKPSYTEFVRAAAEAAKVTSTKAPTVVYASPVRVPERPVLRTTASSHVISNQKSEGQILRPEAATDIPLAGRYILRNPIIESESSITKPVTEEPEAHGNLIRRQLEPDRSFDVQQHLFNLRQSHGSDLTDVYSASVTTGTPRPLFTTTSRPQDVSRSTPRFPVRYHLTDVTTPVPETPREASTTESTENRLATSATAPVVQIPASRPPPESLVALRDPQRGTILIPVSQFQGRDIQIDRAYAQPQYIIDNDRFDPQTQHVPLYIRRIPPPPPIRSMPVQVDENGYVRELAQSPAGATPYPPQSPNPRYVTEDDEGDIDNIQPPVSVRDFQKLLEQLIIRQARLEQVSVLTRQNPSAYFRSRPAVYQHVPYASSRNSDLQTGPVQFIQQEQPLRHRYITVPESQASQYQQQIVLRSNGNNRQYDPSIYEPQQIATRRVARLHNPRPTRAQDPDEGYLPPDVREMLLLKMLQLAINPALPLDVSDIEGLETTNTDTIKKQPVRNVQILGEEREDGSRKTRRVKRYWQNFSNM